MVHRETEARQCAASWGASTFIDPEDVEFKETMKKSAEQVGSRYAV